MKIKFLALSILLLILFSFPALANEEFIELLKSLPQVEQVEQIAGGQFPEKYILQFRQMVNPDDPDAGTFLQRVIVGHLHVDSLVVLHTHGYSAANHRKRITVRDELAELLHANDIFVEHRYFGTSCPQDTNWDYLTTAYAAYDMHQIVTSLKNIYTGKWISTGGSKDGITSTLYSMYYPEDVDVAVPYVAPFCYGHNDDRIIPFLKTVGSAEKRKKILDFQIQALKRRKVLQPMVEHYADSMNMRFIVPFELIYDYCILDYDFGIWMRGISEDSIPKKNANNKTLYNHIIRYANPDMCDRNNMPHQSYYVQAAKELGYYAYDYEPLRKYLSNTTLDPHNQDFMKLIYLPEGNWDFSYSEATYNDVMRFLKNTDCKLMFIYGETDTWTAFAIDDENIRQNIKKYVLPDGCHYSKIKEFPDSVQTEIMRTLREWLK